MNEAAWPLTSSDNTGLLAEPWERMGGGWVVMLTAYNQTDSTLMLIEVLINTAWSKETTQDVKLLLWESAYESQNGCCGSWFDWNFICSWLISNCSRWASGSNTMLAVTVCVCVCVDCQNEYLPTNPKTLQQLQQFIIPCWQLNE